MSNKPEALQPGLAPLYHAFLPDPESIHVSAAEAREAKSKFAACMEAAPDLVARCAGRTTEEVRATLQGLWNFVSGKNRS